MNEQEVYTFIGEVRADLRAIRAMLEAHQAEVGDLTKRVVLLETWRAGFRGYVAGAAAVGGLVAGIILHFLR